MSFPIHKSHVCKEGCVVGTVGGFGSIAGAARAGQGQGFERVEVATPTRQAEVPAAMDSLRHSQGRLREVAAELVGRLEGYVRRDPDKEMQDSTSVRAYSSAHATEIGAVVDQLDELAASLAYILRRLEL